MMLKRMEGSARPEFNKESSEERGNFKSVMINANNSLRQKHQNLVAMPTEEATARIPNAQLPRGPNTPLVSNKWVLFD